MKVMKSATKVMKAVKAMTMKKKAMKKSQVATGKRAKASVFRGTKSKTSGGLTKDKLTKNKAGRIVSKAASAASKKKYAKGIGLWNKAVMTARKELGIKAFQAVGGKSAQGKALYAKAKSLYNA